LNTLDQESKGASEDVCSWNRSRRYIFKVGLIEVESGRIIRKAEEKTLVEEGGEKVVERMAATVTKIAEGYDLLGIGIGSPGSIDHDKGIVRFSPNFPNWINFELGGRLSDLLDRPVYVENDANAFVLGEKWFGAGRDMITLWE